MKDHYKNMNFYIMNTKVTPCILDQVIKLLQIYIPLHFTIIIMNKNNFRTKMFSTPTPKKRKINHNVNSWVQITVFDFLLN